MGHTKHTHTHSLFDPVNGVCSTRNTQQPIFPFLNEWEHKDGMRFKNQRLSQNKKEAEGKKQTCSDLCVLAKEMAINTKTDTKMGFMSSWFMSYSCTMYKHFFSSENERKKIVWRYFVFYFSFTFSRFTVVFVIVWRHHRFL